MASPALIFLCSYLLVFLSKVVWGLHLPAHNLVIEERQTVIVHHTLCTLLNQLVCSTVCVCIYKCDFLQAANNLIVLAREDAGAERIFRNNGLNLLIQLIETKKHEMMLAAIRTLSGMCSRHKSRVSINTHRIGLNYIQLQFFIFYFWFSSGKFSLIVMFKRHLDRHEARQRKIVQGNGINDVR